MKKILSFIICAVILFCTACTSSENANNISETVSNLPSYYYSEEGSGTMFDIIERYNKYCKRNGKYDNQIELVKFESDKIMYDKISTEIMAGRGPDIFSLDLLLPFEKLIDNGSLADINELIENDTAEDKLNLNEYNKTIMDAGVFDGKRYVVPMLYNFDIMISSENILDKFGVRYKQGDSLTYSTLGEKFKNYFDNPDSFSFLTSNNARQGRKSIFYKFLNEYVNFKNMTTDFDTEEFKNSLDVMSEIYSNSTEENYIILDNEKKDIEWGESKNLIFDALFSDGGSPRIIESFYRSNFNNYIEKPVIFNGLSRTKNSGKAFMQDAVAINNNSKHKETAFNFIKYLLSERTQEYYTGTLSGADFAGYTTAIPVRNEAFELNKKLGLNECDDYGYTIKVHEEYSDFTRVYLEMLENINRVSIYPNGNYSYYDINVIQSSVDDYLDGNISKEKFIRELTTATEIYLME